MTKEERNVSIPLVEELSFLLELRAEAKFDNGNVSISLVGELSFLQGRRYG